MRKKTGGENLSPPVPAIQKYNPIFYVVFLTGFYTNQFWDILRTVAEIGAKHIGPK